MKRCLRCEQRFIGSAWACPSCHFCPPLLHGVVSFAPELAADDARFHSSDFATLVELEEKTFWFRARNDLLAWAVQAYASKARNFLEVGCGSAYVGARLVREFQLLRYTATELLWDAFRHARRRLPDNELLQADATRLPYDGEFDAAGAFDVLEHIESDVSVLTELHRALKPAGTLLLTVPQHPFLWSASDEYAQHVRRYTRGDLVRKVEDAGFRIVCLTSFVGLLFPLLLASRVRRRKVVEDRVWEEFAMPRLLDRILYIVMRVELAMIRIGIRLPFGGSLLLVAVRD